MHRIVLSQFIVGEVSRVLSYPRIGGRYHVAPEQIEKRLSLLIEGTEMVEPFPGASVVLADANDDPVIYTAVAGKADVLCTLDRHFYAPGVTAFCARHGIRVMKDLELLAELRDSDAGKGHYA
jgi:predicted nucleic acid-binding protein